MSYAIDERNPERQQLLGRILEPLTQQVLDRLPRGTHATCLDLGCGQGNTTRLLSRALGATECIGVEFDAALVDYASTQPNPAGVRYFRDAGASRVEGGALLHLEHDAAVVKRTYRLSAEATGPLAQARGVLTEFEVREMIDSLARLEDDVAGVLVKFPDMWVIAQR